MPDCLIIGGGLAGLACAVALDEAGFQVTVLEAKPFAGGRAASYRVAPDEDSEEIDNCQHILLRCCVNLIDFYRRLDVLDAIRFHRTLYFLEPGGRTSTLRRGPLPAPLHLGPSFARLRFLGWRDKIAIARAMAAVRRDWTTRTDLDEITMSDWLAEKGQTPRTVNRLWRPVLLSAINEEPHKMAARHGLQVVRFGLLSARDSYEMGVPSVPLGELYRSERWQRSGRVDFRFRSPASSLSVSGRRVTGVRSGDRAYSPAHVVLAVPFDEARRLAPELDLPVSFWQHSPITGIHLWFDRPVTRLPHAALLDRTIQWFFNKGGGRYLQVVVSASRDLLPLTRREVIDLAVRELSDFLPEAGAARLEKAHVVKVVRATFSAVPGLERLRPGAQTNLSNLFLAGDWTKTGWPATMEGAVRSGYRAAEAVTAAAGRAARFLLPDLV